MAFSITASQGILKIEIIGSLINKIGFLLIKHEMFQNAEVMCLVRVIENRYRVGVGWTGEGSKLLTTLDFPIQFSFSEGVLYASSFEIFENEDFSPDRLSCRIKLESVNAEHKIDTHIDTHIDMGEDEDRQVKALLKEIAFLIENLPNDSNDKEEKNIGLGKIIGDSPLMQRLFSDIEKVAQTPSTVLIHGENGTGKDLVATQVHALSLRNNEKFIARNCAAIPGELIESELFGHVKGAFSGAHQDRSGLFDLANNGTLFLDEIGDMSFDLQTKLLRIVETGTFVPVGGGTVKKVDVRLIFATHRDLKKRVEEGKFREDLYYRVAVVELYVPPLRSRSSDIELLALYFLERFFKKGYPQKNISSEALQFLTSRSWPGNVRQLENAIERALIFSGKARIEKEDFSIMLEAGSSPIHTLDMSMPVQVNMLENALIIKALKKHAWNKTRAAKTLGISRRNLIRKVAKLPSQPKDVKDE